MNSIKKPQIITIIMTGIGFFLPYIKVSFLGISESASFFEAPDGKILLGGLVVTLIIAFVQLNNNNLALKITSIIFIVGVAVFYFIDSSKVAGEMNSMSKSIYSFGIGHYISLVGILLTFVLGLLDIFSRNSSYDNIDIEQMIKDNQSKTLDDQNMPRNQYVIPTNTTLNQPINNQNNVVNNPNATINQTSENENQVKNEIKLCDLLNGNIINSNIETQNNEVNLEKSIRDINNINNNTN